MLTACRQNQPAVQKDLLPVEYYLSIQGSDQNCGTDPDHPLKTIAALNKLRIFGPGAHILFKGGETFAGPLLLTMNGTASAPCILGSYGKSRAILTDSTAFDKPICELRDSEFIIV